VLNYLRQGFGMSLLPRGPGRILYAIDPTSGFAEPIEEYLRWDFTGLEIDGATGKRYALSTREHSLISGSGLYELEATGPRLIGAIAAEEMQGLALSGPELFAFTGEDKPIRRYYVVNGQYLGDMATPVGTAELGGTYGGAAILPLPWP
jgi:hypothetical protein